VDSVALFRNHFDLATVWPIIGILVQLAYSNPVYSGYLADPFVLRHGRHYYAYGTGEVTERDGRRFPILQSDDLGDWHYLGGALTVPKQPKLFTAYWAPEVAERNGRFFMYYSAGIDGRDETHRLRVAVAGRPEGPFEDAGQLGIAGALADAFCIDASPFRDLRGRWYLFFATDFLHDTRVGTGIAAVALADDMISTEGHPATVLRASADWQIYERNRLLYGRVWDAWHTVEGPFVWNHDGLYYCFYSGGNWRSSAYGVGYAVAEAPLGPYQDRWNAEGPAVLRGIEDLVLGPGHNCVVQGPDGHSEFMIYHAWDPRRSARRMCIDPLVWAPTDGGVAAPRCLGPTVGRQFVELGVQGI
jgi:arabinan endo-1,5-alpha-L-arabinosidase